MYTVLLCKVVTEMILSHGSMLLCVCLCTPCDESLTHMPMELVAVSNSYWLAVVKLTGGVLVQELMSSCLVRPLNS